MTTAPKNTLISALLAIEVDMRSRGYEYANASILLSGSASHDNPWTAIVSYSLKWDVPGDAVCVTGKNPMAAIKKLIAKIDQKIPTKEQAQRTALTRKLAELAELSEQMGLDLFKTKAKEMMQTLSENALEDLRWVRPEPTPTDLLQE